MGSRILLLNHTRMGDLIQTTPLIKGLKATEPDCEITVLANAKFAAILKFAEGIDKVINVDFKQFATQDDTEPDVLKVYEYFDRLADELKAYRFDRVINLSHSKFSAMLSLLVGAPDVRGYLSTDRGERLIHDPWLIYFSTILGFRRLNRFNIVDLYMRGAGIAPGKETRLCLTPDDDAMKTVKRKMEKLGLKDGDIVVGFQAGASRRDRRWSPESFAKVADHLSSSRNAKIVLFGAASEKELGDEVEAAMTTPAINLIGETSLSELTAWMKRVNLLLTNDTGTMHIAAAVGTPIAALFFVHAWAEETGPYCENAYIIQADIECAPCSHQMACDHYSCLVYITAEDVIAVCEAVLDGGKDVSDDPALFKGSKVFRTRFHEEGGIELVPVRREPVGKFELLAYLYRPVFSEGAVKWSNPNEMGRSGEAVDKAIAEIADRFDISMENDIGIWLDRAAVGCRRLIKLGADGVKSASEAAGLVLSSGEKDRLNEVARSIETISLEITVLGETHEAVGPSALLFGRRVENMEGDDPEELARQMEEAFMWLVKFGEILLNALEKATERLLNDKKEAITAGKVVNEKN